MRFLDLEIVTDPARLGPHSFEVSINCDLLLLFACFIVTTFVGTTQEARLRYYFSQFSPPTPGSAEAVAVPDLGLGLSCPAPGPTVDGVSATRICSLCAARLETDGQYETTSEADERKFFLLSVHHCILIFSVPFHHWFVATPSLSHHRDTRDQKKRSRISRRVRRLEKTVESLSHGLILALTELKEVRARLNTVDARKTDNPGADDALTTAFSNLSTVVNHSDSTLGATAPAATLTHPSEQPDPTIQCEGATKHTNTKFGALSESRESKFGTTSGPSSVVGHNATEKDCSLLISDDRSPISGLLRPILDFMTCPEVFRFLKWAEAHAGLMSTQLFDLCWVSDNLFNVHGGVRYTLPVGGVITF